LNLEPLSSSELKIHKLKQGVKISGINNPKLEYLGLKTGQIITGINGQVINTVEDVSSLVNNLNSQSRLVLEVLSENGVTERYIYQ
jgi:S1-C subfamily serine protease